VTSDGQRGTIDSGKLWHWVDRLTRDHRQRLTRHTPGQKNPRVQYVPVPSLLTQLLEALASTNSGDGRPGKSTGSRSPLDLAIESLITDMSDQTRRGLLACGGHPRVLVAAPLAGPGRKPPALFDDDGQLRYEPDQAGRLVEAAARASVTRDTARLRHDLAADLRQLPALIIGTRQQALVDEWTDRYQRWVAQAEAILTGDQENVDLRGIRGHACPSCKEEHVERVEPSTDPRAIDGVERFHDPALVIAFRDGQVQHITCRACGTGWWRGDDVDQLSADIRARTPTDHRPAPAARPEWPAGRRPVGDVNHGGRLAGLDPDQWWPQPDTGGGSAA
jgi:hypothetical protein